MTTSLNLQPLDPARHCENAGQFWYRHGTNARDNVRMGEGLRGTLQAEEVIMKESALAIIANFTAHKQICSYISLLLLTAIPAEARDIQPNILFIVADNQPASILGAYGNPDVKTPNIDRLANEGVRFTNAFAVHGMCSPTRYTLLTGLLPSLNVVQNWVDAAKL